MGRQKKPKFDGLPGQTAEAPPDLDSKRLFYSSLYRQRGISSRMATEWMLKYGLLPEKLARKLNDGIWNPILLKDVLPKFNFKPTQPKKVSKFNFKPNKPSTPQR